METLNYDNLNGFFRTVDGLPVRTIFVKNLPIGTKERHLRLVFKGYGTIVSTWVCRYQVGKQNRFGFVTFNSPHEAASVIRRKFLRSGGRKIVCSAADGWHQPVELANGSIIDRRPKQTKLCDPNRIHGGGGGVTKSGEGLEFEDKMAENVFSNKQEEVTEEEERENPEMGDESLVSKLNDDCLLEVFDYLDVKHRVIAGLVCKRWRRIASYVWDSVKQLDFTRPPFRDTPITKGTLSILLGLCPQVRSVNVATKSLLHNLVLHRTKIDSGTLMTIANSCPNLEEIKMRVDHLKDRTLICLARKCPLLKSFSMTGFSSKIHDGEIICFLKNLTKLNKIRLKYSRSEKGTWLKYLPSSLKSLELLIYEFNPYDLIEGLEKNNGCLEELSLVACYTRENQDLNLDTIISLSPNLTNLQLSGGYFKYPTETESLSPVARLQHLTHLDLHDNQAVSDQLIRELVEGCPKLTHLNLSGINCYEFTSKGLSQVVGFPQLTSLRLSFLRIVNDEVLKLLANSLKGLEQLYLMNCDYITDEGCSEILIHCASLDTIDIRKCSGVTHETVDIGLKLYSTNILKPRLRIIADEYRGGRNEYRIYEPGVTRYVPVEYHSVVNYTWHDDDEDSDESYAEHRWIGFSSDESDLEDPDYNGRESSRKPIYLRQNLRN